MLDSKSKLKRCYSQKIWPNLIDFHKSVREDVWGNIVHLNKTKEWIFCCCTNGVWQNEAFLPLESTLLNILNAVIRCALVWRLWRLWIGLARVHFPAYLQPTTHDAALLTASLFERDLCNRHPASNTGNPHASAWPSESARRK